MSVDASAVASVLGISTTFVDLREGQAKFLPQVIALFGQGQTGASFSTTPWRATSAQAAGQKYGYLSPIYLAMRELQPTEGDGVDTIPIMVFPMGDAGGSSAAAGSITVSGTATKQATYRAIVSGIKGKQFTLPAGAVNVSNAYRKIRESIEAALGMPVLPTNTYGTVTAAAGANTGNGTCTSLSVTGTPLPGAWVLTCITAVTNGGIFKLQDPNGNIISNAVTMTAGVGATTVVNVGGIQFTLTDGTTDFAVGDLFTITVPATDVVLTAGWKGASGNDIYVEIEALESVGLTFAITQPTGGAVNPSVETPLGLVGNLWATMGLNCLNIEDTTALDAFATFGETRWGELVHKPLVVFTGNTEAPIENATLITGARKTDRINGQLVAPGSVNLPFVVAARQLARIAKVANNNPPVDYNAQKATRLVPGTDSVQWNYALRDQANKAGSSTIEVVDGVIQLADIVTFYRPTGEDPPGYADVVDIVKLQNVIYNVSLEFAQPEWASAPLVPDDEPVTNAAARKPKAAKAALELIIDALADAAIIVNRAKAKSTITAVIATSNPKRLNLGMTVQVSGNTKIKDIDLKWGFFFGSAQLAA